MGHKRIGTAYYMGNDQKMIKKFEMIKKFGIYEAHPLYNSEGFYVLDNQGKQVTTNKQWKLVIDPDPNTEIKELNVIVNSTIKS